MKTCRRNKNGGWTLVELMIALAVLGVMMSFAVASYETFKAKARYVSVKANMDAIAQAGLVNYTHNLGVWDFSPNPWTPPPNIMSSGQLETWPEVPCPGWYLSWDNGAVFGINVVRVSLRRPDDSAMWSYCVNTFGGGNCNETDVYSGAPTIEITSADVNHLYCNE